MVSVGRRQSWTWDLCAKSSLSRYCYYIVWNSPLIWSIIFAKSLIVLAYFSMSIAIAPANDRNS
jgi:hypothetical protein